VRRTERKALRKILMHGPITDDPETDEP
jgi:hypothetical protein